MTMTIYTMHLLIAGKMRPLRRSVHPLNSPAFSGVSWQWTGDIPHQWNAYDMQVACILEDAFCKSMRVIDLSQTVAQLPYTVDFHSMAQTRNQTGFSRKVRRIKLSMSYTQQSPLTQTAATNNTSAAATNYPHTASVLAASNHVIPASSGYGQSAAPSANQWSAQPALGTKKKSDSTFSTGSPQKMTRLAKKSQSASGGGSIAPPSGGFMLPQSVNPGGMFSAGFHPNGAMPNGLYNNVAALTPQATATQSMHRYGNKQTTAAGGRGGTLILGMLWRFRRDVPLFSFFFNPIGSLFYTLTQSD